MDELVANPIVWVNEIEYTLDIVCGSDYKVYKKSYTCIYALNNMNHTLQYLLLMMGLNNATSIYSCLWCTVSKDER